MISLKSQVTQQILNYYFVNPDQSHYINELSGLLDLDPKNTHRKLIELAEAGVLKSEFKGQQRYFSLDKNSPMMKEYRKIFFHAMGWKNQLAQELQKVPGLKHAYIFGSAATGKMDSQSDIDLLLVGSHAVLAVARIISRLQKNLGREINAVHFSPQEFAAKKRAKNEFVLNILKHKKIELL